MAEFLAVSGVTLWLLYFAGAIFFAVYMWREARVALRPLTRRERLRGVVVTLCWPVGVINIIRSEL